MDNSNKVFSMNVTKLQVDMNSLTWYCEGLKRKTIFLYLLIWEMKDCKKSFLKAGYKIGAKQFKDSYGKIYHMKPSRTFLWIIDPEIKDNHNIYDRWNLGLVHDGIRKIEARIHRQLKQETSLKIIKDYREFYRYRCASVAVDLIDREFTREKIYNTIMSVKDKREFKANAIVRFRKS